MVPPIAIVGAGPCGLTLARLLEINKIDYIVFDRDSSGDIEGQGGSLDIHDDSGIIALQEAGLFDEFRSLARYEDQAMKFMDTDASVLFYKSGEGEVGRPEIDRKQLRRILLNSVPNKKIQWSSHVQDITREDDGSMKVRFVNRNDTGGFRLVVGTDGAWSKVRPMVTSAKPQYSGRCYLQTSISPNNPIHSSVVNQVGNGMCMVLGNGKQLIAQRMSDGSYTIYCSIAQQQEFGRGRPDPEEFRERCFALLKEEYAGWSPELTRWIEKSDGKFYVWSLHVMPVESLTWQSVPGVTLAGDAAHVGLPNGDGVNCAMHDSLQLAQAIVKFGLGSLNEAVAEYEKLMLLRGIKLIEDGWRMFKVMHSDNAVESLTAMFAAFDEDNTQ